MIIYNLNLFSMEPEHPTYVSLPPAPKTVRGEPAFLDVSPKHLLYFNESLLVLRSLHDDSIMTITHQTDVVAAKFSPNFRYVAFVFLHSSVPVPYRNPLKNETRFT